MRFSTLFYKIVFFFAFAAVHLACLKKEVDKDIRSSVDFALAASGYLGIFPVISQIESYEGNSSCTLIYVHGDTATFPQPGDSLEVKIDFGSGCSDDDLQLKKGVLRVTFYENALSETGAHANVRFEDFNMNGLNFRGLVTFTNHGNHHFSSTVHKGECFADDWSILYAGSSTFNWEKGVSISNDLFHHTINAICTNRNGVSFTARSGTTAAKRNSCKWIQSGMLYITPDNKPTRTFDFGDGVCDNLATVIIDGNTFSFELN